QLNTAVAQMDELTQNNAANAEQTAAASEQLRGQSEILTSMVRQLMKIVSGSEQDSAQGRGAGRLALTAAPPQTHAGPAHRQAQRTR
ncbi:MAG: methyl-accepting chemotaxis protein, partial [bacterium]